MNIATYLLLTVPLVGGSLYVYDNRRSQPRPAYDEGADLQVPAPRAEPKSEAGPMLQGDPTLQIERVVRETVERMLKERTGGAGGGTASVRTEVRAGETPSSITLPEVPAIDVPGGVAGTEGPQARFDEGTVKVLRTYMDEIQRREREERQVQMVNGQLDRLSVSLTDSQKKGVVDATLTYQRQVRDALRGVPPGQENREARTKAVQDVREQYSKTIYDLVPAAEAEKIVNGMGQGWRGGGGADGNVVGPGGEGRPRTGAGGQGR